MVLADEVLRRETAFLGISGVYPDEVGAAVEVDKAGLCVSSDAVQKVYLPLELNGELLPRP